MGVAVEPAIHNVDRRIFRAGAAVIAATVLVKIAATSKEFVVAALYGRSDAMDAFLAAFLIPNLLINLIAESMNQALAPTLIRVRIREGHRRAQQLLSGSLLCSCGLLVGISLLMAVLARPLFALTASGFSAGKLNEAIRLFYAMLPLVLLTGIASNCTAVLNTLERFSLPALAQLTMPAAVVGAALLLHARFGVWALVYGTLAGALVHLLLVAGMMQSNGFRFRLSWYGNDEATREVARQYGAVLLSSLVASGGLLVDQGMAATLPPGSVSALVFANRFVSVVVMLLAGAVSSAVVPYFSSMVAIEDWRGCRRSLHTWSGIMAAVSVPITALLIIGAQPLVRLTLQHGAFGKEDTAVVTTVLVMYAVQIPFFVVSRVFYRFIVAMRRTDLVLYCGLLNLGLDIIFNLVLMRRMGIAGIALSTSLWTISTCGFLAFWAYRLLRSAEDAPLALRTSREAR